MHFHKNVSFYTNKNVNDYLKLYETNYIKRILQFYEKAPRVRNIDNTLPAIDPDPRNYLLVFHVTHILSFLAGYYSHYF